MQLERVGIIRTNNNDLLQFIIRALDSDDVYLYHLESKKASDKYVISVYENISNKTKKIIGGININDPDSISDNYLERKDEEIKDINLINKESNKKYFASCPICENKFYSLLNLCEQCEINFDRTGFICNNCGAHIVIN